MNEVKSSLMRSRWAAIGAAVAVSLGGGAVFVANAAVKDSTLFVAIEPCRFNDTRGENYAGYVDELAFDAFQVESKLGSGDFFTLEFDSDDDGLCSNQLRGKAIESVMLNVTVTGGSRDSYLSIWPGDETDVVPDDLPVVSSLNWVALEIVPNAVTVQVDAAGKVNFYNWKGTVHVVVDVVGYFADSTS